MRQERKHSNGDKYDEKVLLIRRVSKKTTGGNRINFSALVVVGDKKGHVGLGLGRGLEVPQAIKKAVAYAKNHLITVQIVNNTIPHMVKSKYGAAQLILKPAPGGAGLKVGSVVRSILSLSGISNASGKIIRSRNQINNAYVVMKALSSFKSGKTDKTHATQ